MKEQVTVIHILVETVIKTENQVVDDLVIHNHNEKGG
jgi:hypothetical protein